MAQSAKVSIALAITLDDENWQHQVAFLFNHSETHPHLNTPLYFSEGCKDAVQLAVVVSALDANQFPFVSSVQETRLGRGKVNVGDAP
jgi:hypothetical protein